MGCLKGGTVAGRGDPDTGLRPVRDALPVRPGLLSSGRPGVEGHRREPRRLRQDAISCPPRLRRTWPCVNDAAVDWCAEVNAAVHSRDLRRPGRAARRGTAVAAGVADRCARGSGGSSCARSTSCPRSGSRQRVTRSRTASSARQVEAVTFDGRVRDLRPRRRARRRTRAARAGRSSGARRALPDTAAGAVAWATGPHRRRAGSSSPSVSQPKRSSVRGAAAGMTMLPEGDHRDRRRPAPRARPRAVAKALTRAARFGRFRAADVRSILAIGPAAARTRRRRRQRRRRPPRRRGALVRRLPDREPGMTPAPPLRRCPPISKPA